MDERFWSKVNKDGPVPEHRPNLGPCWLWTGAKSTTKYGQVTIKRKTRLAHRVSFAEESGLSKFPILDHLCETKLCVRPSHLIPSTRAFNTARYWNGRRTGDLLTEGVQ